MTTFTIYGRAGVIGQPAEDYNPAGHRVGRHAFDDLNTQLIGASVDCDHDNVEVGEIIYAEITTGDALNLVAVVDAPLDQITQPIYFSPTYLMTGDQAALNQRSYIAREATVLGASLTLSPSTVAAVPTSHITGDLRRAPDRSGWPVGWPGQNPLLRRALTHFGAGYDVEHRHATKIRDLREEADREMAMRMRGHTLHYGTPGRVLSVGGRPPRAFTD